MNGEGPALAPADRQRSWFVRSIYAGRDLELFLVTAVATILIVRSVLAATGWPQLGGGTIHFAHLLWGGLGMLIALVVFMAMKGRLWAQLATFAAGIGFGLFIDELGKFITSDNDYFFRPAVAFIYLVFVVLFLVTRALVSTDHPSPQSALVNLLGLASEAAVRPLDDTERSRALQLLAACDADDPMVAGLTPIVTGMTARSTGHAGAYERAQARLGTFYESLVRKRWFKALLMSYLALFALAGLALGIAAVSAAATHDSGPAAATFWTYGEALSAGVSAVFLVIGFVRWRHSRLIAFRWFARALLVGIFITQFFAFYQNQITQVYGLAIELLTYAAIRAMIRQEEAREAAGADGAGGAGPEPAGPPPVRGAP